MCWMASWELEETPSEPAQKQLRTEPQGSLAEVSAQAESSGSGGKGNSKGEGKTVRLLMALVEQLENRLREVEGLLLDQCFSPTEQGTVAGGKAAA